MTNEDVEEQAILQVLDKLYYQAQFAFNHDCARCGNYINDNCTECNEQDRQLIEERIPKWEQKLKECKNGTYNTTRARS